MLPISYDPYSGTLGRFQRGDIFHLVSDAGFDGINIPVNNAFLGDLSYDEIYDTAKLANKHDLMTPTIGFGNHILTTPSKSDEALRHFEIVLNVADIFIAEFIDVWVNPSEGVSRQDSLETLAANLSKMVPACEKKDLKIALEFQKGCPLDNYREGIDFINDTGLPVYLTCDTYHLFNDNADPHTAALAMEKCIGVVHVSGSDRGEPGGGSFDFETFAAGLRKIEFSGPLVVQYKMQDIESIKRSCDFTVKFRDMVL